MPGILPSTKAYDNAKGRRRGRLYKVFRIYQRRYPVLRMFGLIPLMLVFFAFGTIYLFLTGSPFAAKISRTAVARSLKDRIKRTASFAISNRNTSWVNSMPNFDSIDKEGSETFSTDATEVGTLDDSLSTIDTEGTEGSIDIGEESIMKESDQSVQGNERDEPVGEFHEVGDGNGREEEFDQVSQQIDDDKGLGNERNQAVAHLNLPEKHEREIGNFLENFEKLKNSSLQTERTILRRLFSPKKKVIPRTDLERASDRWQSAREQVVSSFRHAWNGYRKFSFGYDELHPLSRTGGNSLGSLGATIVDLLDTAMIMGQGDIVEEAGTWVQTHLGTKISEGGNVNLFETSIRVLGGLMSAFYLSGGGAAGQGQGLGFKHQWGPQPAVYLDLAKQLGDKLMGAFGHGGSVVPFSDVDLKSGSGVNSGVSSTAEVGTLQMEFWALSQETGDQKYATAAMDVIKHLRTLEKFHGLVPIYIDPVNGQFRGTEIRLGSRGDSYYEYLAKVYLQQGKQPHYLKEMFVEAMAGVQEKLIAHSHPHNLTFVAELPSGRFGGQSPKMDHLVCFLPGTLALAWRQGLLEGRETLQLAQDLAHTCFQMYNVTATGLAPEIAYFVTEARQGTAEDQGTRPGAEYAADIDIHRLDRHSLLRPETVESLMYLFRVTGHDKYREWGLHIFEAFEKYTRVETGGYSSLGDVTVVPPPRRDSMETFFLGETLKYLYLLFSDPAVLPLDTVVFNTEAHVFPVAS